jgi:hypothetical protein
MDATGLAQNRSSRREHVFLTATLDVAGTSLPVVLRNLSREGALVTGKDLPDAGDSVLFHRQGLSAPAKIAWCHQGLAGIQFDIPLYPRELLRHIPPKEDRPPLQIKRRPGLRPQPLTPAERAMVERWAAESPFALGD